MHKFGGLQAAALISAPGLQWPAVPCFHVKVGSVPWRMLRQATLSSPECASHYSTAVYACSASIKYMQRVYCCPPTWILKEN